MFLNFFFEWNNNALTIKFISESNFPDDDDTTFFYVKSYFRLLQSFLTESLKTNLLIYFDDCSEIVN